MVEVVKLTTRNNRHADDALKTLEDVLAEARQGEIQAVAIAIVRPDNTSDNAWSSTDDCTPLIGSISLLLHNLLTTPAGDNPLNGDGSN